MIDDLNKHDKWISAVLYVDGEKDLISQSKITAPVTTTPKTPP